MVLLWSQHCGPCQRWSRLCSCYLGHLHRKSVKEHKEHKEHAKMASSKHVGNIWRAKTMSTNSLNIFQIFKDETQPWALKPGETSSKKICDWSVTASNGKPLAIVIPFQVTSVTCHHFFWKKRGPRSMKHVKHVKHEATHASCNTSAAKSPWNRAHFAGK